MLEQIRARMIGRVAARNARFRTDGARGAQIFFYQALEPGSHSRHGTGLQHLSFMVSSRAIVREAHDWAVARDAEIVHEPREFPEYGGLSCPAV